MAPKRIVSVVGARPQFIKAAIVCEALAAAGHEVLLVHTGQHYDALMSDVFFAQLNLPAPYAELGVGAAPSETQQTARIMAALEPVVARSRPDMVLVYGDTTSTVAGALAAATMGLPLAHVEAGVRSFNRTMSEELNRLIADRLSSWLLCPTPAAMRHLTDEGQAERAMLVGDCLYDVFLRYIGHEAQARPVVQRLEIQPGRYVVATIHRAVNADDPQRLAAIVAGFEALGEPVIFPVHPRTRRALARMGRRAGARLRLIEPMSYLDMLALQRQARLVITDSGGVQREAYFARVPCLVVRAETEWMEIVQQGWAVLVPPVTEALVETARVFRPSRPWEPLFGDGQAARRIAEHLLRAGATASEAPSSHSVAVT